MNTHDDDGNPIAATNFQYPNEDERTVVDDTNIRRLLDFLCHYVLCSRNPTMTLIATVYVAGFNVGDVYNCDNTVRSIARSTGLVHVQLSKEIKRVQEELGMTLRRK